MNAEEFVGHLMDRWEYKDAILQDIKEYVEGIEEREKLLTLIKRSWTYKTGPKVAHLAELVKKHKVKLEEKRYKFGYFFVCQECKTEWSIDIVGHCPQCKKWTKVVVLKRAIPPDWLRDMANEKEVENKS